MQYKLGFVGVGVMSGAILDRLMYNLYSLGLSADEILIYDIVREKLKPYHKRGATVASSAKEVFESADIVFIGVKPNFYQDILDKISYFGCSTVVSIMAGIKIQTLRESLNTSVGIIRAMPNLPCQIGKGMTAICADNVKEDKKSLVNAVFSHCGKIMDITEDKFDAVTSISGSGPAYVYMFADSMIKGGLEGGLSLKESKTLALQTIRGAAAYAQQSDIDLSTLIDNVCSKGGTTIEAINHFREKEFDKIICQGVTACRLKSIKLSKKEK